MQQNPLGSLSLQCSRRSLLISILLTFHVTARAHDSSVTRRHIGASLKTGSKGELHLIHFNYWQASTVTKYCKTRWSSTANRQSVCLRRKSALNLSVTLTVNPTSKSTKFFVPNCVQVVIWAKFSQAVCNILC